MDTIVTDAAVERLKIEVAACTRLLNAEGILGYSGHVSARLPDGNTLLIQSFDASRAKLRPDDLFIVDIDGNVIDGPKDARPVNELEIHSEVMRVRKDVNAVFHYHPEIATLFTMVEGLELKPFRNHASRWMGGIPVHDESWHIDTKEAGAEMAAALGANHALLLRAHGAVIVAESVPAIMIDAVHFEENAKAMYDASRLGKVKPLTAAEMQRFQGNFKRGNHISKLWRYYVGRGVESGAIPAEWGEALTPKSRA
jgi:L-ribulose-5-phosphate 4-epimerase